MKKIHFYIYRDPKFNIIRLLASCAQESIKNWSVLLDSIYPSLIPSFNEVYLFKVISLQKDNIIHCIRCKETHCVN